MNKLTIVTAALLIGSSAFADETTLGAPDSDWSGLYVGGQLGYGTAAPTPNPIGATAEGFAYGGHVGYNYDFGNIVVGAELDYSQANIGFEITGEAFTQLAHLKARVGYDMNSVLLYGVGGLVHAQLENDIIALRDIGYALGVGAEYKLTNDWTIGAEYLYNYFDGFDIAPVDIEIHTLQARVSYHF